MNTPALRVPTGLPNHSHRRQACVSVSGRPDALAAFRASHHLLLPPPTTVRARRLLPAAHALYHTPAPTDAKAQVMRDLARARVRLPDYAALRHTLRSPATGAAVEAPTAAAAAAAGRHARCAAAGHRCAFGGF
ncbi:uncharacterized protein PHACADRAFT_202794 [Phanerochaete carnosa HHB-10118-sp]|uniref:Uncharacterized protein n=1 Tax=Phanerochaete carnosa (strain HHB-10118-sp) TaxID=650164 RepID=K5VBJ0_PHACS|nr:uncharacterized protein PHACADRAFT_202794 [Phanerochaete carnosa HHB-10118-sp]EKM48453.1 hypothetical protein PHACADRAFT_202794 [Phanerochaete carnosa HHB-10118-sp]